MRTLKSGLIILVVIAFLTAAYLITNPEKQPFSSDEISSNIKLTSLNEALNERYNFDEKNNLTKALSQDLFSQIKDNNLVNQEEKTLSPDINSVSESLVNKVIGDSLSDLKLVSAIYDSDIKISSDISKEAKNQYIKSLGEINKKDFANFTGNYLQAIVDTYQKIDPSSAKKLAGVYKNLANDYSSLAVPSDWVDIHKRMIIYAENAAIIYQAMADYPTDPIKGYLALEATDSLVNGAKEIQDILGEKIKEIGS